MSTRQEAMNELENAVRELSGHVPFEKFLTAIRELREVAINDACLFERAINPNTTYGAIGRIQAYQEILDLVESMKAKPPEQAES